ncbi:hypothetical protein PC112_g10621 [Phytophthora cactorum]|nr:hypothetical protein PC112_g10621 [Phytophthora cactorum]
MVRKQLLAAAAACNCDSTLALENYGFFHITFTCPLTIGSSRNGTLEVTDTGKWFGVQEDAKTLWEAAISGFAVTTFEEKFAEIKAQLRASGFPLDDSRIAFDHCVVGLPRDEEFLQIMHEGLQVDLSKRRFLMIQHTRGRTREGFNGAERFIFLRVKTATA